MVNIDIDCDPPIAVTLGCVGQLSECKKVTLRVAFKLSVLIVIRCRNPNQRIISSRPFLVNCECYSFIST